MKNRHYIPFWLSILALTLSIGYCFVPILITALMMITSRLHWHVAAMTVTVAILGIAFGFAVHYFQIVQQYEVWVLNRQRSRNPYSDVYLGIFIGLAITTIIIVYRITRPK